MERSGSVGPLFQQAAIRVAVRSHARNCGLIASGRFRSASTTTDPQMDVTGPTLQAFVHDSPRGPLFSRWTQRGLVALQWDETASCQTTGRGDVAAVGQLTADALKLDRALRHYFSLGDSRLFDQVTIDDSRWPPFFAAVYRRLRKVPAGQTIEYSMLAGLAGNAAAVRAVGQAMAKNRIMLVIPCHRVVGRHGLGGFSGPGGLDCKRWLLKLEQRPRVRSQHLGR